VQCSAVGVSSCWCGALLQSGMRSSPQAHKPTSLGWPAPAQQRTAVEATSTSHRVCRERSSDPILTIAFRDQTLCETAQPPSASSLFIQLVHICVTCCLAPTVLMNFYPCEYHKTSSKGQVRSLRQGSTARSWKHCSLTAGLEGSVDLFLLFACRLAIPSLLHYFTAAKPSNGASRSSRIPLLRLSY